MKYRVVLLRNDEYKKTLYQCMTRETAFIHFHQIKDKNKVLFPKKFIKGKKHIVPVKFRICITKISEPSDTFRTLRDDYGKIYTEKPLGDWTIIDSDEYFIEETFTIFGLDSMLKRPNISDIIKRLLTGAHAKNMVKQIIVVHNKLLIYNEDQFDMIICKNLEDAQRLHHTLAKISKKQKIKSLLFMGTARTVMISNFYDIIHEKTKWSYSRIRRTTTRP